MQQADALARGHQAVLMLHSALMQQFANEPEVLASWQAARRVEAKPGVKRGASKRRKSAPPETSGPESAPPGDPSSAA